MGLSIAQQVWIYVAKKPYVQEALEQDITNYSALARRIAKELGASPDAVKAALLRTAAKLKKAKKKREQKITALLRKSTFEIKNKIAAIHSPKALDIEALAFSHTPSGYIYIIPEPALAKLKNKRYLEIEEGLSAIILQHKEEVEEVVGVAAFLFSALASENINILHILDAREDTLLVLKEWDAPLAFKTLAEKLRIK